MRFSAVLISACLFLPQSFAQAGGVVEPKAQEVPKPESTTAQVDRLVKDLGAKDFLIRENADQTLRDMGKAAVPALKRHVEHSDLETRTRVRALIEGAEEIIKPLTKSDTPAPQHEQKKLRRRRPGTNERPDSFDDFRKRMDQMLERKENSNQKRMSFSSATSLSFEGSQLTLSQGSSGVRFTVRPKAAAGEAETFEARDLADFKKKHAVIYERYKSSGIFENAPLDFNIVVPGQERGPGHQIDASKALEERLRRLLDATNNPGFGSGGTVFGTNDEFMKELEEKLQGLFERTDRGGLFRDLDRARRLDRKTRPLGVPSKRMLGVEVSLPPASVALDLARKDRSLTGLYVAATTRASLAENLGLKVGDVILTFNGKSTAKIEDLKSAFQATKPGESIKIQVWRDAELKTLSGTIQGKVERPLPKIKKLRKL
ncbi:MAG: hypothetical protein ACI97A_004032 [Planctomycetota bacterium]|jgi:hypothetical protein